MRAGVCECLSLSWWMLEFVSAWVGECDILWGREFVGAWFCESMILCSLMLEYRVRISAVCDCHAQIGMIFSGSRIGCRFIFFDQDCPECTASALLKAISFVIYKREMQQQIYMSEDSCCASLPAAAMLKWCDCCCPCPAAASSLEIMRLLLLHLPLLLLLPLPLKWCGGCYCCLFPSDVAAAAPAAPYWCPCCSPHYPHRCFPSWYCPPVSAALAQFCSSSISFPLFLLLWLHIHAASMLL